VALDYTTAPTVAKGSAIDSRHFNKLADAFNDRFLGGVGDPTYRLAWYLHSIFRGMRNQQDANVHAAHDEWWKFYAHIEPLEYDYPTVSAGLPQGINVGNPLGGFVFGNENAGIYNEPDRINYDPVTGDGILLHNVSGAPTNDIQKWEIGKYQRGVTDSTGEDLDQANALVAAQHHLSFRFGGMWHKGYGGFLPSSTINGYCADGLLYDYSIKFRKLSPQTDCTYSSCPEGSGSGSCPGTSKGVYSWRIGPKDYILTHWDGTITKLPLEDYIQGPYTGSSDNAQLRRTDGDQISRILNMYTNEFRGDDSERALSDYFVEDYAFDFQDFFSRQYFLAPAYGVASGYGDGSYNASYTQFDFNSDTAAGYGTTGGTYNYDIHSGFVCAGFIAVGDGLTGSKTFTLEVDGVDFGSVTIDGTTDNQSAWFEIPKAGNVKIRCNQAMGSTESAYCEIAEILEMKPANEDAYIVLRMASANTTNDDGDGHDTSEPKTIWEAYERHGMIYNGSTDVARSEDTYINRNPIYMTARKYAVDRTRMAERILLKGYEVAGGKSILYFQRKARGVSGADVFRGIAPSEDPVASGSIKHNVTYIVESGTTGITYDGSAVAVGSTFTGVKDVTTFTKSNGDEVVMEYDGIIETAGAASTDNRWTMFIGTNTYNPSDESIYKPDSYGDILSWGHDRCAMFSDDWTDPTNADGKEMSQHVNPAAGSILQHSENPSGYRYGLGTHTPPDTSGSTNLVTQQNDAACDGETEADCQGMVDHYKSCQIYVPDYEIESVTMSGTEVKVTLAGRLRRNSTAPASVTNSSAGWDSYLGTETGPRTDENAIVEYLRWSTGSGGNCVQRIGDFAPDASASTGWSGTVVKGSCHPRFHFTRLIPKVYEDNNNVYESHDTRVITDELVWMDLVLRGICEGYVDQRSTNELREYLDINGKTECYSKRLFDYTYENLFNAANSNRWPRLVPLTERSDNPKMFGPLPMVYTYAEHFNQIARAVNLLTRARLYLPVRVRHRHYDYIGTSNIPVQGDGNCYNGAVWQDSVSVIEPTTLDPAVSPNPTAWTEETGSFTLVSYQRSEIADNSGQCVYQIKRRDYEYYIDFSPLALNALPDDLHTLVVTDNGTGFAAAVDDFEATHTREVVATEAESWGYSPTYPPYTANGLPTAYKDDLGQWQNWEPNVSTVTTCEIVKSGILKSDEPPDCDYVDTFDGGFGEGSNTERRLVVNNIEAYVEVPLV